MRQKKYGLMGLSMLALIMLGCSEQGQEQVPTAEAAEPGQEIARANVSLDDYPTAPDFTLNDLSGEAVTLSDFRGKLVILNFWATWCAPCRDEIPVFVKLQDEYSDKGLAIIGISLDDISPDLIKKFAEGFDVNYPMLMYKPRVVYSYGGIYSIPTTFIITPGGKVVNRFIGNPGEAIFRQEIGRWLREST
jgi:thiol-disulfide isomerase/thioredoxin